MYTARMQHMKMLFDSCLFVLLNHNVAWWGMGFGINIMMFEFEYVCLRLNEAITTAVEWTLSEQYYLSVNGFLNFKENEQ